jgi:hypothetical protein
MHKAERYVKTFLTGRSGKFQTSRPGAFMLVTLCPWTNWDSQQLVRTRSVTTCVHEQWSS